MCGIAGIISSKKDDIILPNILHKMTDVLCHRGPDDSGYYFDEGIGLGHRRLSIIDLKRGHQPMSNEDRTIWITYNGEIYNYKLIRTELISLNHEFLTNCDTEVVIHAYEQWGIDCLKHFNGFFAFCIWDKNKQRAFLARDRLGIKPLFWALFDNKLLFSSEIPSILQYPNFPRRACIDAISSYLTFRQAVGNLNFIQDINKLPPGHFLIYENGKVKTDKFWELPINDNTVDYGEKYYLEGVYERLQQAIKRRMMSDVPLGAYLSGGVDSSILVAMMAKASNVPIKTFAIGYEEDRYNEWKYSQIVSKHCSTNHLQIVLPKKDYINLWPKLIKQRGVPLSIPHEVALYQMSVELKKHVTVVLSGEGADELFGGYGRVQRSSMDWKKINFARKFIKLPIAKGFNKLFPKNSAIQMLCIENHMEHFFHVYNWIPFDEKQSLFTADALSVLDNDDKTINIFRELFDKTAHIDPYDRVLHVFEKIHLGCLLDRLDMMSMAASVEARVPFVDHELVEFVTQIPFKYKMRWKSFLHKMLALFYSGFTASEWLDVNKDILRKVGSKLLPKEIYGRKKLGFPTPLDLWFRQGLNKKAKEILLDPSVFRRGIFRKDKIDNLLNNQQNLDYDFWGKKIWMLMNVELWFQEVVD